MSMTSPTTGSLSVSVPGGDLQILLVVVAVPEYFKSHQTYGYQVSIKSTLTTTSTPETTTTAYTTESTEGFRHLKTQLPKNLYFLAILIAGGATSEVEIWNPEEYTNCRIPSMPSSRSYHGTLNGLKYCGPYGGNYGNETECVEFNQGVWSSTNSGFQYRRPSHTSWETLDGIYIMGGDYSPKTSEFARNDGTVTNGFVLQYPIRF